MTTRYGVGRRCFRPSLFACAALLVSAGCDTARETVGLPRSSVEGPSDYTLENVSFTTPHSLDDLSTVTFRVHVANVGGSVAQATSVSMYVDGEYEKDVAIFLPGGAGTTVTFLWPAEAGSHQFLFSVDHGPDGSSFVVESDESNNTYALSLDVPFRERQVVAQDTIPFASLPSAIIQDSLVQELIVTAGDSGYSIPAGAMTVRTRYDEGSYSLVTPFSSLTAAFDSAPVLVVMRVPAGVSDTVTASFLFHAVDSASFRLSDGFETFILSEEGDSIAVRAEPSSSLYGALAASSSCGKEARFRRCLKAGFDGARCLLRVLGRLGAADVDGLIDAITRTCKLAAGSVRNCIHAFLDDPPEVATFFVPGSAGVCKECEDNGDRVYFTYRAVGARARDDRGPLEWLTSKTYVPTCEGENGVFIVRDCAGRPWQTPATTEYFFIERKIGECHEQGGGSSMFLEPFPSFGRTWIGRLACGSNDKGTFEVQVDDAKTS